MVDKTDALLSMFREVLAPLIEADGGVFYLISLDKKQVSLHLGGTYNGCPGTGMSVRDVLEPAVHAIAPKTKLKVTSGWTVPKGAERITSES
jgi:Fe-S cluster biogenesis protein NfuA